MPDTVVLSGKTVTVFEAKLYTARDLAQHLHIPTWPIVFDPDHHWVEVPFVVVRFSEKEEAVFCFDQLVDLHISLCWYEWKQGGDILPVAAFHLRPPFATPIPFFAEKTHPTPYNLVKENGPDVAAERMAEMWGRPAADIPVAKLAHLLTVALSRVESDEAGRPTRLYPFTRGRHRDSPRFVTIDPRCRFGEPFVGKGVPTAIIAGRFRAGETPAELAEDYGLDLAEVEESLRYATCCG